MSERADERPIGIQPEAPELDRAFETDTPATLRPAPGLTMIAGDTVGVCEGDACVVPWMRNEDED